MKSLIVKKKVFPSFRRKPESRVPGENRDPVLEMVPGVRRDDAWMPAFAGMTNYETISQRGGEILGCQIETSQNSTIVEERRFLRGSPFFEPSGKESIIKNLRRNWEKEGI